MYFLSIGAKPDSKVVMNVFIFPHLQTPIAFIDRGTVFIQKVKLGLNYFSERLNCDSSDRINLLIVLIVPYVHLIDFAQSC